MFFKRFKMLRDILREGSKVVQKSQHGNLYIKDYI